MLQTIQDKTKSTIIKKACPYCSKVAIIESETIVGTKKKIKLQCGHTYIEILEEIKDFSITSLSGKVPFKFQYETSDFIIRSNFRTGVFHEQGVGKTACPLITIARFPEKLVPFAVICKGGLRAQWFQEILDWTGIAAQIITTGKEKVFPELFKAFIISYDLLKSRDFINEIKPRLVILDECQQIKNSQAKRTQALRLALSGKLQRKRVYTPNLDQRKKVEIIAKDLMKFHGVSDRFQLSFEELDDNKLGLCECKATKDGRIEGKITIDLTHALKDKEADIIDTIQHEIAHAITPGAGHHPIWQATDIALGGDGKATANCSGSIEVTDEFTSPMAVIALSGTPIKNHAGEYFPILNMLRPEIFPSQTQYERDYCNTYQNGWGYKVGGLSKYGSERFRDITKDWIIRYEREEVLPDLPKIFRKNYFVELGEEVEAAYKKAYIEFQEEYLNDSPGINKFGETGNLIAKLNRLRHLTGIAKILPVTEWTEEYLESNDRKLVLFVRHKNVGVGLQNGIGTITKRLGILPPLSLTSENNGTDAGNRIDQEFKTNPKQRVMIASIESAGEGKNWQMCSDAVIVERLWNPANEEQAEGRFPRPGSIAQSISITYAVALGTPDEFLTEIVERKREICKKTYGHTAVEWDQTGIIKELSEQLFTRGGKRWNL